MADVDVIIHLAACTRAHDKKAYYQTNVEGTKRLLETAGKSSVKKIVYLSTRAIGEKGGDYSHSKSLAEEAIKASKIPWIILRPSEIYGTDRHDSVQEIYERIRNKKFVPLLTGAPISFNPVYVDDVINGIMKSIESPVALHKTYNLCGPKDFTYEELIAEMAASLNVKAKTVKIPASMAKYAIGLASFFHIGSLTADQVPRLLLNKSSDIIQARQDLGFNPRPLRDGLKC